MDKEALVGRLDREAEGLVLAALSHASIPISLVEWNYVPQLGESQLIIATSLFDSRGPHEANSRVLTALSQAGIYQDMPIRRIFVKSPNDPTVKALERELRSRTDGSIHVLHFVTVNNVPEYSVVFSPYAGGGGAVPSRTLVGTEDLRDFLDNDLDIPPATTNEAIEQLRKTKKAFIPNVQLTARKAKRLRLA